MAEETKTTENNTQQTAVAPTKDTHLNLQTDYSLGIFGTSDNFKMAWQMSQSLAASTIVPSTFQNNPANCLIAIEQANRLNMSPFMVMQNLYIIQGKPSWSSKFLIAMINGSRKFDHELQYDEKTDANGRPYSCLAWTTKNGRRIEGMKVTMDMAKEEGWLAKNGSKWKTLPALMLRYRAASFFASLNCPELTLGIYTKEEYEDNDFKDYPATANPEVKRNDDVKKSANSVDFEDVEVKPVPAEEIDKMVTPFQ
jgi:hypothetical protein